MGSEKEVVIITGSNTGLGLETVKSLLGSPQSYHILLCGRSLDKASSAAASVKAQYPQSNSSVEPLVLDYVDDESIQNAFQKVKTSQGRLDILVNNAGATFDNDISSGALTTRKAWQKTFDVNVIGPHVTTQAFMPLLVEAPNPRLIFIGSGLASLEYTKGGQYAFAPPPKSGWPKPPEYGTLSYRSSKAALHMTALDWWRTLTNDKVKVWALNPGFLATHLGRDPEAMRARGAQDPAVGAAFVKSVIEGKHDDGVGTLLDSTGALPW